MDSFHSFYFSVFCGSKFCGFGWVQEHAELYFWVDYQLIFSSSNLNSKEETFKDI